MNRTTIRGIAVATGVAAASSVMAVGAATVSGWADERASEPAVTTLGPWPAAAAVTRLGPPAGRKAQLIKERQRERAAKAARQAREARQAHERASRAVRPVFTGDPRRIGASLAASRYGWGADQFSCLDSLWTRESGWNPRATNPSSGAYGIPQALPGSKMSAYGADWQDNPVTQIEWGLAYIEGRYGTPCGAWSSFQAQGWY